MEKQLIRKLLDNLKFIIYNLDGSIYDSYLEDYIKEALKDMQAAENYLKEEKIKSIRQRIHSEYRKHHTIDWMEVAARKIYNEHFNN